MVTQSEKELLFNKANEEWESGKEKRAISLFLQAAKLGDVASMNSIGYFYDMGIAVRRDKAKALHWYKKAARNGDICACSNIGTVYRDFKNFRRAKFWFLKALSMGDGDAALELGRLYFGKEDIPETIKYLRKVIAAQHVTESSQEEATLMLNRIKIASSAITKPVRKIQKA